MEPDRLRNALDPSFPSLLTSSQPRSPVYILGDHLKGRQAPGSGPRWEFRVKGDTVAPRSTDRPSQLCPPPHPSFQVSAAPSEAAEGIGSLNSTC